MIEEREELMIPTNSSETETPKLRKAHFIKPALNPRKNHHFQCVTPSKPPDVSLNSNPSIPEVTRMVLFKGRPNNHRQTSWKSWVDSLQQTHQSIWKKAGIFDAIMASTYEIKRHNQLVVGLAEKWCPETNTFMFPWGEVTITLEDIMVLGGFSVLGVSVLYPSQRRDFEEETVTQLVNACSEIRNANLKVTQNGWMDYFKGKGGDFEHVGLLVFWLSRYVFPTSCYGIAPNVFVVAVSLARGVRIALAPAVLGLIYKNLTLLREKLVAISEGEDDGFKLCFCAPFEFVHLWVWERFPALSPNPVVLGRGEPRLARWRCLDKVIYKNLRLKIESAAFLWRPYASALMNWELPKFYRHCEKWVSIDSKGDQELLSFAMCLRPCVLVGLDCVEQYLPHRVGMQFGMNQDIPEVFPRSSHDYDEPVDGLMLYVPSHLLDGDVTMRYSNWWVRKPSVLHDDSVVVQEVGIGLVGENSVGKGRGNEVNENNVITPGSNTHLEVNQPLGEASNANMDISKMITFGSNTLVEVNHPLGEASNADMETRTSKEPPMDVQVNDSGLELKKDEKEVKTEDNPVVILDDLPDENNNGNPVEVLCNKLEAKMADLERLVSRRMQNIKAMGLG